MKRISAVLGFICLSAIVSATGIAYGQSGGSIVGWGSTVVVEQSALEDLLAVAGGGNHSLGLKSDGTIVAWGYNGSGQCNIPAPNTDFVAVAGGSSHSLGLKSDGTIVAWGSNGYGQCDVPLPNADFDTLAGGYYFSLGLKSDGTILAWGDNYFGQCNVPEPNADFVAVSAGYGHSLGLRKTDDTPVFLATFTLEPAAGQVLARWELAEPDAAAAFRLVGSEGQHSWDVAYTPVNETLFTATDRSLAVQDGGSIGYALYGREGDEGWQLLRRASIIVEAAPAVNALLAAFPNPFNPHTSIRFELAAAGPVRITIHDLAGRLVARLYEGNLGQGEHETTWRGCDLQKQPVASGVYFARLEAEGYAASRKLVLLR